MSKRILVAGAGGLIGGHLATKLAADGHYVVGVDKKHRSEWEQIGPDVHPWRRDLSIIEHAHDVCDAGWDEIYMLAADMGGIGFIEGNKLDCMLSTQISTNMLVAASEAEVGTYFYSSSACVYAADKQTRPDDPALREEDAYPAQAEDGYGWEKLFTERMCRHFYEDRGLETRVARFHNVYGTHTTWRGGREKAPAAICRKVAQAVISGDHTIDIWGDGEQSRSFMDVADCIEGMERLVASNFRDPINLGSAELVTINQLVSIVEGIAGVELHREYDLTAPQGVRGRNSDNSLIRAVLGWEPSTPLQDGLERLYAWVYDQVESEWMSGI